MSAGTQPTKADLDAAMGTLTRSILLNLRRAADFNTYFAAKSDAELTALGYDAADIANVRSAFADLNQLNNIATGAAAQANAVNFFTFPSRLWGAGGAY